MTNLCLPSLFSDSKKPGLLRALVFSLLGMGWYAFVYDLENTDGRRIPEHYDEPYTGLQGTSLKLNGITPFSTVLK
jgi:hypothetical protein